MANYVGAPGFVADAIRLNVETPLDSVSLTAASVAALTTDSTTGTAQAAAAAGVGVYPLNFHFEAATFANGDMITAHIIPHKFKILSFYGTCTKAVTTGAKSATLNIEIGTTDLTGGVLTLDGTVTLGATEASTAITGNNTGAAGGNISIEASAVTTFVEGSFTLTINIQNMDTADAFAALIEDGGFLKTTADALVVDVAAIKAGLD